MIQMDIRKAGAPESTIRRERWNFPWKIVVDCFEGFCTQSEMYEQARVKTGVGEANSDHLGTFASPACTAPPNPTQDTHTSAASQHANVIPALPLFRSWCRFLAKAHCVAAFPRPPHQPQPLNVAATPGLRIEDPAQTSIPSYRKILHGLCAQFPRLASTNLGRRSFIPSFYTPHNSTSHP